MKKRTHILIICLSLICLSKVMVTSCLANKIEIKFATLAPEGTTWMQIMDELNTDLQKQTNDEVKFKIYPGGTMGDEKDVIRKMRSGQLHSAGFTGNGLGEILPEIRVMEVPFLFNTSDEVDAVVDALYDEFAAAFEEKGFVLLGWAEVGFVHVFSQKPITKKTDMDGIKMWTWEGDVLAEETFKAMGVSPFSLSVTDVLTSLQTGMIDGFYTSPLAAIAMQWYTKAKYMSMLPITNASGAVLITTKQFNKIPAHHQETLKKVAREHLKRLVKASRIENEEAVKVIAANHVELVEKPTGIDLQEFISVSLDVRQKLIGKLYSQELLNHVEQALKEYRTTKSQAE